MRVACMGLAVCDFLVSPVPEDVMRHGAVLLERVDVASGGDAVNVALNLSKLGVQTRLFCGVGHDIQGDYLKRCAREAGVDDSHMRADDSAGTSTSIVLIREGGEHTFAYYGGASSLYAPDAADMAAALECDVLFIGSACMLPALEGAPLIGLLERAQSKGVVTAMDMSGLPEGDARQTLLDTLAHIDYFLPSIAEAAALARLDDPADIADALCATGAKNVAIKLGERGSYLRCGDTRAYVEGYPARALDTTGAGDSFVSGFLAGMLRGYDPVRCARLGNRAGAMCVERYGATAWRAGFEELCALAGIDG